MITTYTNPAAAGLHFTDPDPLQDAGGGGSGVGLQLQLQTFQLKVSIHPLQLDLLLKSWMSQRDFFILAAPILSSPWFIKTRSCDFVCCLSPLPLRSCFVGLWYFVLTPSPSVLESLAQRGRPRAPAATTGSGRTRRGGGQCRAAASRMARGTSAELGDQGGGAPQGADGVFLKSGGSSFCISFGFPLNPQTKIVVLLYAMVGFLVSLWFALKCQQNGVRHFEKLPVGLFASSRMLGMGATPMPM